MRYIKLILGTVIFTSLAGCAQVRTPINPANEKSVHSTKTLLTTEDQEIAAKYRVAAPVYGPGLLTMLIVDSINSAISKSRATHANQRIAKVRNALVDYNFVEKISKQMRDSVSQVAWLHAKEYKVLFNPTSEMLKAEKTKMQENTLLYMNLDYYMPGDDRSIVVNATVALYPNNKKTNSEVKPLYTNVFTYADGLAKTFTDEKATAVWAANNGKLTRQALDQAAKAISKMLVMDISNPQKEPSTKTRSLKRVTVVGYPDGKHVSGYVLSYKDHRALLRLNDGSLYSVNEALFIK